MNMTNNTPAVTRRVVAGARRRGFLPRVFGGLRTGLDVESRVYSAMGRLCPSYRGGLWEFVEIRGGGYMVPAGEITKRMRVCVASNHFEGELSLDAAGIVATMFALNAALMAAYEAGKDAEQEALTERFYALREFARNHPEAGSIMRAID